MSAMLMAGCGGLGRPGNDAALRTTVEVDYLSVDTPLEFVPGALEYGLDPWASHDVELSIWTDDWVQRFAIYDRYTVDGGRLMPADGASLSELVVSDAGPFGAEFAVEVPGLDLGEHRFTLELHVHLEPAPAIGDALEAEDRVVSVDFVYDVYWADSPLDEFCATADQLLRGTNHFSPEAFIEAGAGVLSSDQMAGFEGAASYYHEEAERMHLDPNPIFDLVEDVCDVSYGERWEAFD